MQRSIDRLVKASQKQANSNAPTRIIDEDGKIRFNRLLFDYDTYQTILSRIIDFDYKKVKFNPNSDDKTVAEIS